MARRLISWPHGLKTNYREPLSGPRTVGAGSNESIGGFVQTFGAPFGLWRWRFQFANMRGQLFRRYRGWITALHGGANATRVPFCDWDGLSLAQRGVQATHEEWKQGQPWGNGEPWSNGKNWGSSGPVVPVAAASALGATEIRLGSVFWGATLDYGDLLGFFPFHFGMYMVTEAIGNGTYRIWPPLRKPITLDDFATLEPMLAMRLESEEAATAARDAFSGVNLSITMVEVLDYDVRDYFAG